MSNTSRFQQKQNKKVTKLATLDYWESVKTDNWLTDLNIYGLRIRFSLDWLASWKLLRLRAKIWEVEGERGRDKCVFGGNWPFILNGK